MPLVDLDTVDHFLRQVFRHRIIQGELAPFV